MKQFKTLVALVLALALTMTLVGSAMAASITVNNTGDHKPEEGATDNTKYEWYRIFDASFVNGTDATDGVRYYTTSADVKTALESITVNGHKFTVTAVPGTNPTEYNITSDFVDADAEKLADELFAKKSTWVKSDSTFAAGEIQTVTPGYYLVTSTLGSKIILDTLGAENINEKNEYITDTKTVAKTNYNIGDKVLYTITVTIPATTDFTLPVTVHDNLQDVLKLDKDSVAVKNGESNFTTFSVTDPVASTTKTGFNTFDIVLNINSLANATTATTLTITYEAELLKTAAADTELVNEEFTEYSDYTTKPKDVKVKTFDFDLKKTFVGATTQSNFEATFALFESDGTTAINLIEDTAYEKYHRPDSTESATANTFKVKGGGTVNVKGLAAGTYTVKETATSAGYNMLTDVITVTIDANGDVSYTCGSNTGSGEIPVENNAGSELPSTGGIGTTIFYIAGAVLVLGAAAIVIARRKAEQD